MIIFRKSLQLNQKLAQLKKEGKTTGFVPTMGALHSGHIALMERCKAACEISICSIFVNPAQFNDPEDFKKYPITIEDDIYKLCTAGADILFLPSVEEMYPEGLNSGTKYELSFLENILEGYYRPGHFQGVCRVMHKLLDICEPDELFMGQKDYQQCLVVKKLLADYHLSTRLNIVPTIREESGLAMSSRNLRLSAVEREKATGLYKALNFIKENFELHDLATLKKTAMSVLLDAGFEKIDYLEICNAADLSEASLHDPGGQKIALTAAFIGGVRLIDNLLLN